MRRSASRSCAQLEGRAEAPGLVYRCSPTSGCCRRPARARRHRRPIWRRSSGCSSRRAASPCSSTACRSGRAPRCSEFRGPKARSPTTTRARSRRRDRGLRARAARSANDVRRATVDGTEFAVVSVEARAPHGHGRAARRWSAVSSAGCRSRAACAGTGAPRAPTTTCASRAPSAGSCASSAAETLTGAFYGLQVGDVSQGHRVLGSPIVIDRADHYERHLEEQKVIVSQHERRRIIGEGLDARAAELDGAWSDPGDVLAEAVLPGRVAQRRARRLRAAITCACPPPCS